MSVMTVAELNQRRVARRYIFDDLMRPWRNHKRMPKPEVIFADVNCPKRRWARVVRRRGKPPLLVWVQGKP